MRSKCPLISALCTAPAISVSQRLTISGGNPAGAEKPMHVYLPPDYDTATDRYVPIAWDAAFATMADPSGRLPCVIIAAISASE